MAFIPIDAKADLQGQKKGKITPAQHAQLNAWCLASKTGILDFPQDHTKKGRCEIDALNITNIQNYETEIIFNKGYLVICGRLVECEEGTRFTFKTPVTGKETGSIVAKFSLGASGDEEFKIIQKTGALIQNDLNDSPVAGEYEFELYSYEATPTSATLTRTQPYVPDIGDKVQEVVNIITNNISGTGVEGEGPPPLQDYKLSEGTIEERLTRLGFKEGSVTGLSGATLTKVGTYAILKIPDFTVTTATNITVDLEFEAKNPVSFTIGGTTRYGKGYYRADGSINGKRVTIKTTSENYGAFYGGTQIGFEIIV